VARYALPFPARQVNEAGLPLIAVPPPPAIKSEVTRFTIITDETTDEKPLCAGIGFMPVAALDRLQLTPQPATATTGPTGIDALTHAIEA